MTTSIQALQDRDAIFALKARYARGLDRHDFDEIGACFAENSTVSYQHPKAGVDIFSGPGRDKVIERLHNILGNANRSTHFMANKRLTLKGDQATLELYAESNMIFQNPEGKMLRIRGLRYRDELAKINGEWLLTHVQHAVLWEIMQPAEKS